MNNPNFTEKQQRAIEQMFDMNRRSTNPPKPEAPKPKPQENSFLGGFSLPFLDNLKKDGDMTLVLGILLLLLSEKADKRLLFALIYILL